MMNSTGMDLTVTETPKAEEAPETQDLQATVEAALKQRVANLVDKVTFVIFSYIAQESVSSWKHSRINCPGMLCPTHHVSQGLFERHKLALATQLTMAILRKSNTSAMSAFALLMAPMKRATGPSPLPEWLPDNAWAAATALKANLLPTLVVHIYRSCSLVLPSEDVGTGCRRLPASSGRPHGFGKAMAGMDEPTAT